MTSLKKTKLPLIASILSISAIAGIGSTASAATHKDCAGGYFLAVKQADSDLQKDIQSCFGSSASLSCVQDTVTKHQQSQETAITDFDACIATAVPATKPSSTVSSTKPSSTVPSTK